MSNATLTPKQRDVLLAALIELGEGVNRSVENVDFGKTRPRAFEMGT